LKSEIIKSHRIIGATKISHIRACVVLYSAVLDHLPNQPTRRRRRFGGFRHGETDKRGRSSLTGQLLNQIPEALLSLNPEAEGDERA
jgi:hypothetical protein